MKEIIDRDESPIEKLLNYGRENGYLTSENILRFLPGGGEDIELLDRVFEKMSAEGIELFDEEVSNEDKEESPLPDEIEKGNADYMPGDDGDLVKIYFSETGNYPLLTQKEEIELSKKIEEGLIARERLAENSNLEKEKKKILIKTAENGLRAREILILSNTRLVISIAKKEYESRIAVYRLNSIGQYRLVKGSQEV